MRCRGWSLPRIDASRLGRELIEVALPVGGHGAGRAGYRLVGRMTIRWGQDVPFEEVAGAEVVEPVFARLEALDDGVSGCPAVGACVLAGRVVTTTDMPAGRAAAQVEPPPRRRSA